MTLASGKADRSVGPPTESRTEAPGDPVDGAVRAPPGIERVSVDALRVLRERERVGSEYEDGK